MLDDSERLDRELRTLANQERRKILDYFISNGTEVTSVEVLSCRLARLKVDQVESQAPSTETTRRDLHHIHLPKLADANLVDYDARSGKVRYRPDGRVESIVTFLDQL